MILYIYLINENIIIVMHNEKNEGLIKKEWIVFI